MFLIFLVRNPEYCAVVCKSVAACRISFVMLSSLALGAIEVLYTAMETAINGYASISFVGVLFCPFAASEKSNLLPSDAG